MRRRKYIGSPSRNDYRAPLDRRTFVGDLLNRLFNPMQSTHSPIGMPHSLRGIMSDRFSLFSVNLTLKVSANYIYFLPAFIKDSESSPDAYDQSVGQAIPLSLADRKQWRQSDCPYKRGRLKWLI